MAENTYYRDVLYTVLALAALGVFLFSRHKFRNAFLFFVCTLGLGYRTFAVTPALRIIPAEVVLWVLPLLALRRRPDAGPAAKRPLLPWWLWLMLPFWIFAWIPAAENGFSWDVRLAEFRNFALAVPLFLAAPVMLARAAGWRAVVVAFLGVSVWIAAMGIVEYVFPGVAHLLPGFVGNPDPTIAGTFKRANFSFFGSATAVFICILALPLSLAAWAWWRSVRARIAVAGGAVLQLIALYISGYRSMWLLLGGQAVLYVVVKRKFWLGALFIGLACLGYGLLPDETRDRLHSLEMILQGKPEDVDTSGAKRWNRADDTTQYALEQPTGHGWAASGWVHSDFLQVAANQGLIPAALLLAAYLTALVRLGWRLRSRRLPAELAPLGVPLFLTFAAVGGILLFEGVEFLPQTILPVWLMWALAETWLVQTASPVATARRAPVRRAFSLPRAAPKAAVAGCER